jgi:hopene-associated glycosyltransferase HpnB
VPEGGEFVLVGVVAALILALWAYLVFARGGFWRARERDDSRDAQPAAWPPVTVIVPARDEAATIALSIRSLLKQDYPGAFHIILVDDQSRDDTAGLAQEVARSCGDASRLTVVAGLPLPPGWTGKLWAQHQGIAWADERAPAPRYLLLTDADIVHAPDALRWLVTHAEARGLVLTSLMAKLRCDSVAERLLVPAFIFFFQMLYPFAWVNDQASRMAAAAGGCMLLRRDALRAAGGIAAIRAELIDDCALARKLKQTGPIWLGLTQRVHSIRPYPDMRDVGRMIARSAYAQLDYSVLMLLATVLGMMLVFVAPVLLTLLGSGLERAAGAFCWILMAFLFQPTLRFYRLSPLYGVLLPLIAAIYVWFTCASALAHARGLGGMWKGRAQAGMSRSP